MISQGCPNPNICRGGCCRVYGNISYCVAESLCAKPSLILMYGVPAVLIFCLIVAFIVLVVKIKSIRARRAL